MPETSWRRLYAATAAYSNPFASSALHWIWPGGSRNDARSLVFAGNSRAAAVRAARDRFHPARPRDFRRHAAVALRFTACGGALVDSVGAARVRRRCFRVAGAGLERSPALV